MCRKSPRQTLQNENQTKPNTKRKQMQVDTIISAICAEYPEARAEGEGRDAGHCHRIQAQLPP